MVSEHADIAVYQQVAEEIRRWVAEGRFPAGSQLPTERGLVTELGVGREAVRDALAMLRREGIVDTHRGRRARIRDRQARTSVELVAGDLVTARMPSPEECAEYGIQEGVPIFTVGDRVFPADRFELRTPQADRGGEAEPEP